MKLLPANILWSFQTNLLHYILQHVTSLNRKIKIVIKNFSNFIFLLQAGITNCILSSEAMYFRLDWTGELKVLLGGNFSYQRVATRKIDCIVPREFRVWWLRTDLNLQHTTLNTFGLTSPCLEKRRNEVAYLL